MGNGAKSRRGGQRSNMVKSDGGYMISHRPATKEDVENGEASYAYDLTTIVPPDIYTKTGNYEDMSDISIQESISVLKKIKGKPDAEVTIYRGSPSPEINNGDWVTLSKSYAMQYSGKGAYNNDGSKGKIYSMTVKAKELTYEGNSINEFGYIGVSKKGLKPFK